MGIHSFSDSVSITFRVSSSFSLIMVVLNVHCHSWRVFYRSMDVSHALFKFHFVAHKSSGISAASIAQINYET
jgi:hypothetical protein